MVSIFISIKGTIMEPSMVRHWTAHGLLLWFAFGVHSSFLTAYLNCCNIVYIIHFGIKVQKTKKNKADDADCKLRSCWRKRGRNLVLRRFQPPRPYYDKIETRNREENPISSRIAPSCRRTIGRRSPPQHRTFM